LFVQQTGRSTLTDSSGHYRIDSLRPGTYAVLVRRIGFQSAEVRGVKVERGKTYTLNFEISPAAATQVEEIRVTVASGSGYTVQAGTTSSPMLQPGYIGTVRGIQPFQYGPPPGDREQYGHFVENPFLGVAANPLSTFGADVDRAGYSNVRRIIMHGQLPPVDAVRVEELVNYFPYSYAEPSGAEPIAVNAEVAAAPWAPTHRLVRIGIQARRLDLSRLPPSNLVFLMDVSGSMWSPNKLPLLKSAFRLLVEQLRPVDHVAIVAYAGRAGEVLPSTRGDQKETIMAAIDSSTAQGSTVLRTGISKEKPNP